MHEIELRHLDLLAQTERLPVGQLVAYQARLAEHLIRHAGQKFPFYAARLQAVLSDGRFHPERWADIPILTRPELQAAISDIVALDDGSEPGWTLATSTSGSTGVPLSLRWTWLAHLSTKGMMERLYKWHALDPNACLATIRVARKNPETAWPNGLATGPWSVHGPTGTSFFLDIATPVDRQIEWLCRIHPRYLSTNPTNLHALAAEIGGSGRALDLEAVITVGEILDPQTRRAVLETFGASVIDTYGCQELGKIALACPDHGLMHVCAENMIIEILDESDQPVEPGESGRVVLTGFYNLATPLIRYAIGDFAETAPAPCPCGRTLPGLKRVLGRQRNMFRFADNSRIWPQTALVTGLTDLLPLKQFQLIQTDLDRVELRYVPVDPSHRPDIDTIRARLRTMLHPTIDVTLRSVTEIPRGAGGKFEDFVSLVSAASPSAPV